MIFNIVPLTLSRDKPQKKKKKIIFNVPPTLSRDNPQKKKKKIINTDVEKIEKSVVEKIENEFCKYFDINNNQM